MFLCCKISELPAHDIQSRPIQILSKQVEGHIVSAIHHLKRIFRVDNGGEFTNALFIFVEVCLFKRL